MSICRLCCAFYRGVFV